MKLKREVRCRPLNTKCHYWRSVGEPIADYNYGVFFIPRQVLRFLNESSFSILQTGKNGANLDNLIKNPDTHLTYNSCFLMLSDISIRFAQSIMTIIINRH